MSKIIAVFSPSGGVGVSTIASHLAYHLAADNETALVDMVLDFGSQSDFLKFNPELSAEKVPFFFKKDSAFLEKLSLPSHRKLKLFSAPSSAVSQQFDWKLLLSSCKDSFQNIVLDLPHTFLAPELTIGLEQADVILLVSEYAWASVLNTKQFLENSHEGLSSKCQVVFNKYVWMPQSVVDECHQNIKDKVVGDLPYQPEMDGVRKVVEHGQIWNDTKKLCQRLGLGVKAEL
ncbi:MAG: hypothetical protein K2X81_16470 [Candidatus Obscuribacterales bacterium]|nr:hypothetical protein [Candidatus Obscuribacterales bacterium]